MGRTAQHEVKKQVLNTEKERTRKSSKTHIGEPSLARFGLPLNQQHTIISDTCSTCPTSARNVHRHTGAWCTIGMCTRFNALFVTILSMAHVSDTPSYCKIRILSTGAYIRNQQPGWVLIFEGAYFHGVLINECGSMQLCGNRLAVIYFRPRGSFPASFCPIH